MTTTCRVCGENLHEEKNDLIADEENVGSYSTWVDDGGDIICPAKDWDDGAGPYHEPKDTL